MRDLFNHEADAREILPGSDWVEAVETARKNHGNDPLYANGYIRALGSALGGCALITGDMSTQISLDKFSEAAEPPLTGRESADLQWGYSVVITDSMKGVAV